jgi:hypothetical protein
MFSGSILRARRQKKPEDETKIEEEDGQEGDGS